MVNFRPSAGGLGQPIGPTVTPNSNGVGPNAGNILRKQSGLDIGSIIGAGGVPNFLGSLVGSGDNGLGSFGSSGSNPSGEWLPNPLSAIDQPAYHVKLVMTSDVDSRRIMSGDFQAINNGIIIAETGASEFNITELNFDTVMAPKNNADTMNATSGEIKITEPLGASFFDRILAGISTVGAKNYLQCPYFLIIRFHGYDPESGQYVDEIGGKTWYYSIRFYNFEVNVNEGGAKYVIQFVNFDDFPHGDFSHFGTIDLSFAPQASTVGEFFDLLKQNIENAQIPQYGYVRHIYNFQLHDVPLEYNVLNVDPVNPSTWALQNLDFGLQSSRSTSTQAEVGETNVGVSPYQTIADIVTQVFSATLQAQQLVARSPDPSSPSNDAYNAVVWKVQAIFRIRDDDLYYDAVNDSYNYNITFHIIPHVRHDIILSIPQRQDSMDQQLVKQKMEIMKSQNRLVKEYQYLFTGLNTEVINFDINANFAWFAYTPDNMMAFDKSSSTPEMMSQYQLDSQQQPDLRAQVDYLRMQQKQLMGMSNQLTPTMLTESIGSITSQIESLIAGANSGNGRLGGGGSQPYIETMDYSGGAPLPLPFDRDTKKKPKEYDGDVENDILPGQAVYMMSIAQIAGSKPVLMELDMTIRGDPYWLGVTTIEGQPGPEALHPSRELPDFFMSDNEILIQFFFPKGIDEQSGAPILEPVNLFTGLYIVHTVSNKFANGVFTQQVKGVRNVNATYLSGFSSGQGLGNIGGFAGLGG